MDELKFWTTSWGKMMTIQQLDFYFPFYVFAYGFILTFILNQAALLEFAEQRLPAHLVGQLKMHRGLAMICLCAGGAWSLQNLWVGQAPLF
jgi:hypothetical protein